MDRVYYRAAGGVVVKDGQLLLLDRPSRNEVRLPKGHVEDEETWLETAVREVQEETGYVNLKLLTDLGSQRVSFTDPHRDRNVTRDERYFMFKLVDDQTQARHEKEQQFRPFWVPVRQAAQHLTFEAERSFVRRACKWLERTGSILPEGPNEGRP